MASFLITGCSRGLGLELIKLLISSPANKIFATARNHKPSSALQKLIDSKASNGRVRFIRLEITDDESIASAVAEVSADVGKEGLDVLINSAGIQIHEGGASQIHTVTLEESFNVNVIGAHKVSSAFIPLLSQGQSKKIVNISSKLGSMSEQEYSASVPCPSYKITKAALNMLTIQYAMELGPRGFIVFCACPGWMQTDLGGPAADLTPEQGARGVIDLIHNSKTEYNGTFRNISIPDHNSGLYDGKPIPW